MRCGDSHHAIHTCTGIPRQRVNQMFRNASLIRQESFIVRQDHFAEAEHNRCFLSIGLIEDG
jgi:hypothetical protein